MNHFNKPRFQESEIARSASATITQDLKAVNSKAARQLETHVLRLLTCQYRSVAAEKSTDAAELIEHRIKELGGVAPHFTVYKKRLVANVDLVRAAIEVVPHLNGFCKNGTKCNETFIRPVSSALADAFQVAGGNSMSGADVNAMQQITAQHAVVDADKGLTEEEITRNIKEGQMRVMSSMILPTESYIDLINTIPVLIQNSDIRWLEDNRSPGRPLRYLSADIKNIARLVTFVRGPARGELTIAVRTALTVLYKAGAQQ